MVVNYKLTNIEWKENTDLPTELDLPESCLDKEGHPDKELILYWLEDEIGYACDGFEIVEIENRISKEFGHLLSWEEAEKFAGRKLDWNNNRDCCIYFGLLMTKTGSSKEV